MKPKNVVKTAEFKVTSLPISIKFFATGDVPVPTPSRKKEIEVLSKKAFLDFRESISKKPVPA